MTTGSAPDLAVPIPADDIRRQLTIANADSAALRHLSVAGDTHTVLVRGDQTGGRYCLIDMYVPPGGGPPPHRHDFEEMFVVLEGEVEFAFRGKPLVAVAGTTISIPANAPHAFRNSSSSPARMLCLCSPAGQENLFAEVGDVVGSRTAPPPPLTEQKRTERKQKAKALSGKYRTELL